jgi:hypothetical protein
MSVDYDWISPRKMIEYYLDYEPSIMNPEKELYEAVINGDVRARSKGIVFGPEWLKQLDKLIFNENNPYALPPDIGLSVQDARRKWNLRK